MASYPYALQLYSVRDYLEKNPADGLTLVQKAGYRNVELAGDYNLPVEELKDLLDARGLVPVSMHTGYDQIVGNTKIVIEQALILQVSYVVVPWLGGDICTDRDGWIVAVQAMNDAGVLFNQSGLCLCYHNHAHEFERYGDETIFDLICSNSDPKYLKLELDLCWALVGKADIPSILNHYAGRIPLIHVKDCRLQEEDRPVVFTELGKGMVDLESFLPVALDAGVKWFIVEQDTSEMDTMNSAEENAVFMRNLNQQAVDL